MKRIHGFTLIELMVVIVIAAILMGIAAPALRDFVINNRITTTTNDLLSAFALARSTAAQRGVRVTICKSADGVVCQTSGTWQEGWIVFTDSSASGTPGVIDLGIAPPDTPDEVLRVHEALPSLQTLAISPALNFIQYRPSGPTNANGNVAFELCQTGYYGRVITISPNGRALSAKTTSPCS